MRKHTLVIALLVLTASGCYSRLTGNNGRFTFAYEAAANVLDFNKPIAPGARLNILVQPLAGDDELKVQSVESSAPGVIRIAEQHPSHVVIQGGAAGTAELTITTQSGLTDVVTLHVAPPDEVLFAHSCTDDAFAVYPADSDVVIPFGLSRGDGQAVAGYGFWPIRVNPSRSLTLDRTSRDQGALHFKSGAARHRVAIRSTIDDAILGLALASNAEVDGIGLDVFGAPWMVAGESTYVGFEPTVGGVKFCQASIITRARSLTPEICEVSGKLDDDSDRDENTAGLVRVKAKAYGLCDFEVEFPEAENGQGVRTKARVPVGKFPDPAGDGDDELAPEEQADDRREMRWIAPLLALLAPLLLLPLARRVVRR